MDTWPAPVIAASTPENTDFRPTIAVIPFEARSNEPEHFVIGELIADGIIAQLSRSPDIRVISRLSTTAFRGRTANMPQVQSRLDATFVLSGSYLDSCGKILLMAELADTRTNEIVWAERVSGDTGDLLQTQSELLNGLAAATCRALIDAEVQQSLTQPMPRLDSSSLLLGGISMMHRSTRNDFERSKQVFEALIERHNRAVAPRAWLVGWLAKWYVLRAVQGISDSQKRDTERALELTLRALDMDPHNALVLAIQGYIHCQLSGDVRLAETKINHRLH